MTDTTNLGLPCIEAAQAQKHVTHNDALRIFDALVQIAIVDRDLSTPPALAEEGQRWIVASGGTDTWSGRDNAIAAWQDGGWQFYAPKAGWLAYAADEGVLLVWNGGAWVDALSTVTALQNLARLGLGTAADAANPLSAKLNNALFAARTVAEGGDGTLRYRLSKESADKTLSLLFQDNFSGRAEIGLTGDDDFHLKVSGDGENWVDSIVIDRATGATKLAGLAHPASGASIASLVFTPGGDGTISIYRIDSNSAQNPRNATIASLSDDIITLTQDIAETIFSNAKMAGVSFLRIWNVSKSPNESAWVKAQPAADQVQVRVATDIAGWSAGDTIQAGDPTTEQPGRVIALDISPMMQAMLGTVFRQTGVMAKASVVGGAATDKVDLTSDGSSGSFVTVAQYFAGATANGSGVTIVPCTEPSPISNSNLVFVRETLANTGDTRLVSLLGLLV
jgi:hypothetical protein